jgi:hypothetical protein
VGVEVYLQAFLISALDGGDVQLYAPAALPLRKDGNIKRKTFSKSNINTVKYVKRSVPVGEGASR